MGAGCCALACHVLWLENFLSHHSSTWYRTLRMVLYFDFFLDVVPYITYGTVLLTLDDVSGRVLEDWNHQRSCNLIWYFLICPLLELWMSTVIDDERENRAWELERDDENSRERVMTSHQRTNRECSALKQQLLLSSSRIVLIIAC